jgi:hypothetical protein
MKIKKSLFRIPKNKWWVLVLVITFFTTTQVIKNTHKQVIENPIETEYMASSPNGQKGGVALPASCASCVWNNNNGYHLVAPYTDPGTCSGWEWNPQVYGPTPVTAGTNNTYTLQQNTNAQLNFYIDWGDGTAIGSTGYIAAGNVNFPMGHTYANPGTYTISVRAMDVYSVYFPSPDWLPTLTVTVNSASYNCESGNLNPSLNIVSDNGVAVRFNNAMRWFNNRIYNACYYNQSGKDIFVPSNSQAEKDAWNANKPAGVTRGGF